MPTHLIGAIYYLAVIAISAWTASVDHLGFAVLLLLVGMSAKFTWSGPRK